jgi:hypothetical protein
MEEALLSFTEFPRMVPLQRESPPPNFATFSEIVLFRIGPSHNARPPPFA